MKEELNILIQAQYPLIYVVTSEEERAVQSISRLDPNRKTFVWSVTQGLVEKNPQTEGPSNLHSSRTASPEMAIDEAIKCKDDAIFVFKDLHPFFGNAQVNRALRDAVAAFKSAKKSLVLISPVKDIPIELEKDVVLIDFALPNMEELNRVLTRQLDPIRGSTLSTEAREKLLKAVCHSPFLCLIF